MSQIALSRPFTALNAFSLTCPSLLRVGRIHSEFIVFEAFVIAIEQEGSQQHYFLKYLYREAFGAFFDHLGAIF